LLLQSPPSKLFNALTAEHFDIFVQMRILPVVVTAFLLECACQLNILSPTISFQ
jgi:hypothetical protein